jgi:hypothetical protein
MNLYEEDGSDNEETAYLTMEQYQEHKAQCVELLRQSTAAIKLADNPEFKELIMGSYFDNEPKRLAGLMSTGRLSEKQFNECVNDLKSIGSLRSFLEDFTQKGRIAQSELENLEIAWNDAVVNDGTVDGSTN